MRNHHDGPTDAVRAVLFDFDGTLADTTELIMRSYRHSLSRFLDVLPTDAEWLEGFGTPLERQIARFARSEDEHARMVAAYREYQEEHHDGMVHPFPGAVATVSRLAELGVPMAIVTSKHRRSTLRGMELCGLVSHIEVIVTPEDVTHAKPHPEPVIVALERLEITPEEAVFVGDSPHDIAAGKAAKTRTAAALWGPFPRAVLDAAAPDYSLESIEEVMDLVRR